MTDLPVTKMFLEMIAQGYFKPVEHMEELRLPGEFVSVPLITTYGTPDIPIRTGVGGNAKRSLSNNQHTDESDPLFAPWPVVLPASCQIALASPQAIWQAHLE